MSVPGFTAEATIYRSMRQYAYAVAESLVGTPLPVELAYFPGPETQARCSDCTENCAAQLSICSAGAASVLAGCFFPPACPGAVALAGELQAACDTENLGCQGYCEAFKCCPKPCGIPNPFNPGEGCCDSGEHCVDGGDPNARSGCCPSERAVCGGNCCAAGENCCGDSCCPADFICQQGTCCPPGTKTVCNGVCCDGACDPSGNCCPWPSHVCGDQCCPPFNKCCAGKCCGAYQQCHPISGNCWTPTRPPSPCRAGWTECGGRCCSPDKQCCIPPGGSLGCYYGYECIH